MDRLRNAAGIRLFLARVALLAEWEQRVLGDAAIPSARRLEPYRLRDYVPRFIDIATEALRGDGFAGALRTRAVEFARVHVVERIDEGFALEEALRELTHLGAVVLEHLADAPESHADLRVALQDAHDVAVRAYAESGTRLTSAATSPAGGGKRGVGRLGS